MHIHDTLRNFDATTFSSSGECYVHVDLSIISLDHFPTKLAFLGWDFPGTPVV
jgi:hypothetical protein